MKAVEGRAELDTVVEVAEDVGAIELVEAGADGGAVAEVVAGVTETCKLDVAGPCAEVNLVVCAAGREASGIVSGVAMRAEVLAGVGIDSVMSNGTAPDDVASICVVNIAGSERCTWGIEVEVSRGGEIEPLAIEGGSPGPVEPVSEFMPGCVTETASPWFGRMRSRYINLNQAKGKNELRYRNEE